MLLGFDQNLVHAVIMEMNAVFPFIDLNNVQLVFEANAQYPAGTRQPSNELIDYLCQRISFTVRTNGSTLVEFGQGRIAADHVDAEV